MSGLEGRTLDRYELQRLIGKGGMADVYLALDTALQRLVAVKVFKRDEEEMLKRFTREARLMQRLRHPHLVPIYDTGQSTLDGSTLYYIVMPFMEGGTLRAHIRSARLSPGDACSYLRQIADALDYVHQQGIIHRDIKSSNVLLDAEGTPYLTDFGIARTTNDITRLTSTGDVLGTVDYVAPELFEPNQKANALSDLYSLGVLLFEMVTGRLPFTAENQIAVVSMHMTRQPPSPRTFAPEISPQVERVVLRALAKKPEQRYGSATALADAFCQAAYSKVPVQEQVSDSLWEQLEGVGVATPIAEVEANAPTARAAPPVPAVIKQAPTVHTSGAYTPVAPVRPVSTPRPTPSRVKRPVSPVRSRFITSVVLALFGLFALIGISVYAVLFPPKSPAGNGSATQTIAATVQGTPSPTQISTPTPNFTATAQAIATATQGAANATATAIAGATATAVANATAITQAQATATAGVIQTVTAGTPGYTDSLNDPNNAATVAAQWGQNSHCAFEQDGYHVTVSTDVLGKGQLQGCLEEGHQYTNFALSVDLTILSGHTGGVFFRVGKKTLGAYSGYLFEIDNQGDYKISRSGNFSTGSGNETGQDTTSPHLKTGTNATNTLQIFAGTNSVSFYVNGFWLDTWSDTTFTTGSIAFLATTADGGANADMLYSNLKVYPLS
jgi:serine/threonine protein kinase